MPSTSELLQRLPHDHAHRQYVFTGIIQCLKEKHKDVLTLAAVRPAGGVTWALAECGKAVAALVRT